MYMMRKCAWTIVDSGSSSGSCTTGSAGISSCAGRSDGDYQSCKTCHGFVSCSNENLYEMPCAANLVFDDKKKLCDYTSATCNDAASENTTTGKFTLQILPERVLQALTFPWKNFCLCFIWEA